jgi:hypothetical protein
MTRNPVQPEQGPNAAQIDRQSSHHPPVPGDPDFEHQQRVRSIDHAHDRHMRWIDLESSRQRDALQFIKEFGLFTLRACLVLNGGAILSLLAFIGNVYGRAGETGLKLQDFTLAFSLFAAGLVATVLSSICGYFNFVEWQRRQFGMSWFAQFGSMNGNPLPDPSSPVIVLTRILAAALAFLALAFFVGGVVAVTSVLSRY